MSAVPTLPYPVQISPKEIIYTSYSSDGGSAIVYLLSIITILVTLFGSVQTFRFYERGDISSRFPLLLLFNAFCILIFAIFAIVGVATNINQYSLNVILISTAGIAFTIQLLRSVRLLFTIEVRYFISKQFANQFAYGEAEVDMLLNDDHFFEGQSEGSEDSYQDGGSLNYDEDDDEYYDEFYEESLQYSASYFDYAERDAEFGNDADEDEERSHASHSTNPDQPVVVDAARATGQTNSTVAGSSGSSLFSTSSDLSAELENEDDVGNSLGRWIFQHKSLATAPFMTGLSIFIFAKYIILTVLFTTAPGLEWAFILWLAMLSLGVISCALTVMALKMVRIRSYYIYERTLQDYNDKYFPRPTEEELIEHDIAVAQNAQHEAAIAAKEHKAKETQDDIAVSRVKNSDIRPSKTTAQTESSSSRGSTTNHRTRTGGRVRSGSESSENIRSGMRGVTSTHTGTSGGHSKMSKADNSSRGGIKRATNGQQYLNAAGENGNIGIFGTVIVGTNKADIEARKKQNLQARRGGSSTPNNRITSTTGRSNTGHTSTTANSAGEKSLTTNSTADDLQIAEAHREPDPNRPPPPTPPPTTLFTSTGDPSGQMLELLSSALLTSVCYSIALIIAIVYTAKYDPSQYSYFTLTPTKYSPAFTRGILILLSLANLVISYSSLVHVLIADYLRAIKYAIIGGQPQVDVAAADMDDLDSLKKILADNAARDEFRKFLDGEFSAENLLFWNAIEEYRSRPTAHFQSRTDTISSAKYIFSTYLAPGGVYEVNISSQCREKIATRLKVLLEDDPIHTIRQFENGEVNESLQDWIQSGALYHTFIWNEVYADGLKTREIGDADAEANLPKGARAIASVVVSQFAKSINDSRRTELAANPYPTNLFEQYCLIQVRDLYESILRLSQLQGNDFKAKQNAFEPGQSKLSKHLNKAEPSRTGDFGSRYGRGAVQTVHDDGPLPNPPQLPDTTVVSTDGRFENIMALLNEHDDEYRLNNYDNTPAGRKLLLSNQGLRHRGVQITVLDENDEMDQDDRIEVGEWSYTRDDNNNNNVNGYINNPNAIENNIPVGWTIYDFIRYKHTEQKTFKQRYQNALDYPYANPPELPGAKRRGRPGRGRGGAQQQGFEVEGGQRLHHALMSYEWKIEACRRRLKHYTDIVDELVLVFDAAQLEIFKLMERDSFARFVKTPDFQQFVSNRNANKAQQDE
jgi:hypothetical protein